MTMRHAGMTWKSQILQPMLLSLFHHTLDVLRPGDNRDAQHRTAIDSDPHSIAELA
jgi:hypothetical protein